ncbi:MAG TPA: DUF6019 family protein [Bacteroidia bacterium]|nr:DUF6019 family protein [Bacteroidia bacterium]
MGITIMLYSISAVIGWAILYYTIKYAVKNGIIEARENLNISNSITKHETLPNKEQEKLQILYDKGEISFDEYKNEWSKLDNK